MFIRVFWSNRHFLQLVVDRERGRGIVDVKEHLQGALNTATDTRRELLFFTFLALLSAAPKGVLASSGFVPQEYFLFSEGDTLQAATLFHSLPPEGPHILKRHVQHYRSLSVYCLKSFPAVGH